MKIEFFVPGIPQPGGSKKAFVIPGTNRASVVEDAKRNAPWRSDVVSAASRAYSGPILDVPLSLSIVFVFPRPKGHYGSGRNANAVKPSAPPYPAVKPDITKLIRSTEDALKGVLWRDDTLIVEQEATKVYGVNPGARVVVVAKGDS